MAVVLDGLTYYEADAARADVDFPANVDSSLFAIWRDFDGNARRIIAKQETDGGTDHGWRMNIASTRTQYDLDDGVDSESSFLAFGINLDVGTRCASWMFDRSGNLDGWVNGVKCNAERDISGGVAQVYGNTFVETLGGQIPGAELITLDLLVACVWIGHLLTADEHAYLFNNGNHIWGSAFDVGSQYLRRYWDCRGVASGGGIRDWVAGVPMTAGAGTVAFEDDTTFFEHRRNSRLAGRLQ